MVLGVIAIITPVNRQKDMKSFRDTTIKVEQNVDLYVNIWGIELRVPQLEYESQMFVILTHNMV